MIDEAGALAISERIFGGFNRGDVASFADCLHSDIVAEFPFSPPGMFESPRGQAAVLEAMTQGRAMMASMTITPSETYWSAPDETLVIEAKGKAQLRGGTPYNNSYVFMVGFRDGRVILWREYFDSLLMQHAIEAEMAAG